MTRSLSPMLLAAVLIAGCAAEPDAVPPAVEPPAAVAEPEPVVLAPAAVEVGWSARGTDAGCAWFCEPTVAPASDGRVFVLGDRATRSFDGGATFEGFELPPVPIPGTFQTDGMLATAPDGTLWYSALLASCTAGFTCDPFFLLGIQVARSDDDGGSWQDQVLGAPLHARAMGADRQWLTFGPEGTVCVSFQHVGAILSSSLYSVPMPTRVFESDLRVSCASDGWTFPEFSSVAPQRAGLINGQPVFDADGRLLLPLFLYTEDEPLHVAVSEDGGATFELLPVGGTGAWFPSLAVDGAGILHMLWNDDHAVRHATSADGGRSWGAPETLATAGVSSPWIARSPAGGIRAAWFEEAEEGVNRLQTWDGEATTTLVEGLPNGEFRVAATDFAHLAWTPEGRALVVYGDLGAEETFVLASS